MHTQHLVDAMVVVRAVFAVRTTARFHAGQSNVPASNQAHRHHTVTHCSLSRPPPQVSNGQERFKPIKITYSRPSDVWSAGLMVNDMGTGFRLLGHPVISTQLLGNMFHIFGVPTPEMWPGVQHLDGYKAYCSPAQLRALYVAHDITAEDQARGLLDNSSQLAPDLTALAAVVKGCLALNPVVRLSASAARDILSTVSAQLKGQPAADAAGTSPRSQLLSGLAATPPGTATAASTSAVDSSGVPASTTSTQFSRPNQTSLGLELQGQAPSRDFRGEMHPTKKQRLPGPILDSVCTSHVPASHVANAAVTVSPAARATTGSAGLPPAAESLVAAAWHPVPSAQIARGRCPASKPTAERIGSPCALSTHQHVNLSVTTATSAPAAGPSTTAGPSLALAAATTTSDGVPGAQQGGPHGEARTHVSGCTAPVKLEVSLDRRPTAPAQVQPCPAKCGEAMCKLVHLTDNLLSNSSRLPHVAVVPPPVAQLARVQWRPRLRLHRKKYPSAGHYTVIAGDEPCSLQRSPWLAAPENADGLFWVHDRIDGSIVPRLAKFLTPAESGAACELIAGKCAQGKYRSLSMAAADVVAATKETAGIFSKRSVSAPQAAAPGPGLSPASAFSKPGPGTRSTPSTSAASSSRTASSSTFGVASSSPGAAASSPGAASSTPGTASTTRGTASSAPGTASSMPGTAAVNSTPPVKRQRKQQHPADSDKCRCNGNCFPRHRGLCPKQRECSSEFCSTCKCEHCHKQSYRMQNMCFSCSKNHLPPVMLRVQSLSPFLSQLLPADIEQFLALWPTVKDNLFAQVLIAWVKEPFPMDYLARRLSSTDGHAIGIEATYNVLLEACRCVHGQTPQTLINVGKDLSRQGVARTTGFLAAMVGMGVAEGPLRAMSSPRDPAAPGARKRRMKPHEDSDCGLRQQAGNPTTLNKLD